MPFVKPVVFGLHYLNCIPLLHCLTKALSLSIVIRIVANKVLFPATKLTSESGKALGIRLTFTKIKKIPTDSKQTIF